MGSAIRLTSRNAYDMMKMTRATGSRNEAPPMIVVFKNSFKGSLSKVLARSMSVSAAVTSTLVTGSAATTTQRTGDGDLVTASRIRSLNVVT